MFAKMRGFLLVFKSSVAR